MHHDGNGWSAGPNNSRLWGRFGAAGLLLMTPQGQVLMQHRAEWTSHPLTWALPGGARDSHETPEVAAMRETQEETGLNESQVEILHTRVTAGPYPADPARPELYGGWCYYIVFAMAPEILETNPNAESKELRWVDLDEVEQLDLLPAFGKTWPLVKCIAKELIANYRNELND